MPRLAPANGNTIVVGGGLPALLSDDMNPNAFSLAGEEKKNDDNHAADSSSSTSRGNSNANAIPGAARGLDEFITPEPTVEGDDVDDAMSEFESEFGIGGAGAGAGPPTTFGGNFGFGGREPTPEPTAPIRGGFSTPEPTVEDGDSNT